MDFSDDESAPEQQDEPLSQPLAERFEVSGAGSTSRWKIHLAAKDISANCIMSHNDTGKLISSVNTPGSTFAFVAEMKSSVGLPPETLRQIFAVYTILYSEDTVDDVVNDSTIIATLDKNIVKTCRGPPKNKRRRVETPITMLWESSNLDISKVIKTMLLDPETGRQNMLRLIHGTPNQTGDPICHAKMFVTIHSVKYKNADGSPGIKFAAVLWVVCHRNFDFPGKIARILEDPNMWRKVRINEKNKNMEIDTSISEKIYQMWNDVIEHQREYIMIGDIARKALDEMNADMFRKFLEPYDAQSYITNFSPISAHLAIMGMVPYDATDIVVEGMDENEAMTMRQYQARFDAWRIQIKRFRFKEARERASSGKRKNSEEGEEDAAENDYIEQRRQDYTPYTIVGVSGVKHGGGSSFVDSCLEGNMDAVDEYGAANLPYLPAWPVAYSPSDNTIVDDIPKTEIRLKIDMKVMEPVLSSIIYTQNQKEFNLRFGDLPRYARNILEKKTFAGARDMELVREGDNMAMSQMARRDAYDRSVNPKRGLLENMVYAPDMNNFLGSALGDDDTNNIKSFRIFVDRMFYTMQNDIAGGKSYSRVFESTQAYLQAVEHKALGDIRTILQNYVRSVLNRTGSDFEINHGIFHCVFDENNKRFWGLSPQNMLIMIYFFLCELGLRLGTSGDWVWIGMTAQICDAGGLSKTMCGNSVVTNIKKSGTSGYDLCRNVAAALRAGYRLYVPDAVLSHFPDDGHVQSGTAKLTPMSVAEGTITTLDGKLVKGPGDLGRVKHFPEGLGDLAVIDRLVAVQPRDKNPGFILNSTTDINNNNLRQMKQMISVDGLATCIGTCAQNQITDVQTLNRQEDLMRVMSVLATSGPSQKGSRKEKGDNDMDTTTNFCGSCHPGRGNNKIHGRSANLPDALARDMAPFFSIAFLMASRAALAQKYGILNWDISPPVNFVLHACYAHTTGLLNSLLSPTKIEHTNRVFDTSKLMAGIVKTVWIRTYEHSLHEDKAGVENVVKAVFRAQHVDALHYSLVPGVVMQYLTSTLDFQTLAVMQMMMTVAKIPTIQIESAAEFLRGKQVSSDRDRRALIDYVNSCTREKLFGKQFSLGDGSFDEDTNMSCYVTGVRENKKMSPIRMGFVSQEATHKDVETFKKMKLKKNAVTHLATTAIKYAKFCKEHPGAPIEDAIDTMLSTDYNLRGFFGGFDLFNKPKELFQALFNSTDRFQGLPEEEEDPCFLRIIDMDSGDIAFGLNFPSAVFLKSLMGDSGCDWGLQVKVAESITSHLFSYVIPYSMCPVDCFFAHCFTKETSTKQLMTNVGRTTRPLVMFREGHCSISAGSDQTVMEVDGVSKYGLFEDTAHMYSIISLAKKLKYKTLTSIHLNSWDFEVWWGNPRDVTPLQRYLVDPDEAAPTTDLDDFLPGPGTRAFVKVDDDNGLVLYVKRSERGTLISKLEPSGSGQRGAAQRLLFSLGWGPAVKWFRTGVVFQHPDHGLCTLVPLAFDEIMDGGKPKMYPTTLPWFHEEEMCYLALDGAGNQFFVDPETVSSNLVEYGSKVAVDVNARALQGRTFSPQHRQGTHVIGFLGTENATQARLGAVTVFVSTSGKERSERAFTVGVGDINMGVPDIQSYYEIIDEDSI